MWIIRCGCDDKFCPGITMVSPAEVGEMASGASPPGLPGEELWRHVLWSMARTRRLLGGRKGARFCGTCHAILLCYLLSSRPWLRTLVTFGIRHMGLRISRHARPCVLMRLETLQGTELLFELDAANLDRGNRARISPRNESARAWMAARRGYVMVVDKRVTRARPLLGRKVKVGGQVWAAKERVSFRS